MEEVTSEEETGSEGKSLESTSTDQEERKLLSKEVGSEECILSDDEPEDARVDHEMETSAE